MPIVPIVPKPPDFDAFDTFPHAVKPRAGAPGHRRLPTHFGENVLMPIVPLENCDGIPAICWGDRLRDALAAETAAPNIGKSVKSSKIGGFGTIGTIGIRTISAKRVVEPPPGLVPWHDGVARMQTMRPPLGWTVSRWRQACLDAARVLEQHGAELHALGWTAADVFGLHPDAPGAAVDCYGLAMLLDGGTVEKLTAEEACIARPGGAVLRPRRGCRRPARPAWELA